MQLGICGKKEKEINGHKYICFGGTLKKRMFILCTLNMDIAYRCFNQGERRAEEK